MNGKANRSQSSRQRLKQFEGDGSAEEFAVALGDIARAYGMMRIAEETSITVDALYAAVNGYPADLGTLLPILEAFGVSTS
jgi:probable addiction module antidote protein